MPNAHGVVKMTPSAITHGDSHTTLSLAHGAVYHVWRSNHGSSDRTTSNKNGI